MSIPGSNGASQMTLADIDRKLDEEIANISRKKQQFEQWADEKRRNLEEQRKTELRSGKISVKDLDKIIKILEKYEIASPEEKKYAKETFECLATGFN